MIADMTRRIDIPRGSPGTAATIAWMAKLALEGAHDPDLAYLARRQASNLRGHDHAAEAERMLQWVKRDVRYTWDPRGLEWVQTPRMTMFSFGTGDCDDQAALLASLWLSLGLPARFITYAADPRRPADWSHVAAQVELGHERWLTGDATQAESYLGWDPPPSRVWSTRTWPIDGEASPTRYEMEAVLKYSRGKTRS